MLLFGIQMLFFGILNATFLVFKMPKYIYEMDPWSNFIDTIIVKNYEFNTI